jgi:FKBP-type peptidyl-prolyl cis-trans isomerase
VARVAAFALRLCLLAAVLGAASCNRPDEEPESPQLTAEEVQERLIQQNRAALEQERAYLKAFMDSTKWAFAPAGSGAYEWRVATGEGTPVAEKELVRVAYRLTGVHGEVYDQGTREVRVLRDPDAVWGLQYALMRARHGDSLVLLLPAHLGHGLAGAGEVPPMSPLVYYLRVL